jgi:hypothetical protein
MIQKTPQFPFYYRDFLHAVRHMEKCEAYDYLLLLFEQADSTNGSIPERVFEKMCTSEEIREKFEEDSNGFFNVRMRDILHKRDEYKTSRLKNLNPKKSRKHMGDHMDIDNDKDKDKGNDIVKVKKKKPFTEPLIYPFDDPLFINRWQVWKDYKDEQFNFKYKPRGEQAALKALGELSGGNLKVAIAIIEQSMAHGWKGLFALQNGVDKQAAQTAFNKAEEIMKRHGL